MGQAVLQFLEELMGSIMNFMSGDTLIVVFTGVVALSTVVYAILTWNLVSETRRMREVQTEPRVTVRLEQDHTGQSGYELVVSNSGQGPAKNLRFQFKGDPSHFRNSFLGTAPPTVDQLPLIRDGLDYMEAGEVFRFTLGSVTPEEFRRASESPWKFTTTYESLYGKKKKETFVVQVSHFEGGVFDTNWVEQISDSLTKMQMDLSRLTNRTALLHVVTQSEDEFEARREARLKSRKEEASSPEEPPVASEHSD